MKKLFLLLLILPQLLFATAPTSLVPTPTTEFQLNRWMGPTALKNVLGTLVRQAHNTATGLYDYSLVGGAAGDLAVGIALPTKAIVRTVLFDVITAPTTVTGATLAFKVQSSGDLKGAAAVGSWGTGRIDGIPVGTAATAIKLTAARTVYATVASGALSAGKIKVIVDYVVSE